MSQKPYVSFEMGRCSHCGLCARVCVGRVIDHSAGQVDHPRCIRCGHCIAICPEEALSLRTPTDATGTKGDPLRRGAVAPEDFEALAKARRTTRVYVDKPVPRELIDRLLDLARYAPTGTNSQAAFMTVLSTRDRVSRMSGKIMAFFMRAAAVFANPVSIAFLYPFLGAKKARQALGFAERYFGRYENGEDVLTHGAPCAVLFHAPRTASTPDQDCVIQATSMALHAETLGLGTCFNGFLVYGLRLMPKLRKSLMIPKGHKVYCTLLMGFPALAYKRVPPREAPKANIL